MVSYSNNATPIAGVTVELMQNGNTIDTTTTNSTGGYSFADLLPGSYDLRFSKSHFYDETSGVSVSSGTNTIVDMALMLRGDLDNNGEQAYAVDVNMMIQASVHDIADVNNYS